MKTNALILFLLTFNFLIKGQTNLVPNPSFELYSACPNLDSQITMAVGWDSLRQTPDYFNDCSNFFATVPSTYFGYRTPASGDAFAGFFARWPSSSGAYTESLGTQLISPMQIGTKYYVSCKVSLSGHINPSYCAINKLGVHFSNTVFKSNSQTALCNCANIYTNSIITDTLNWTMIKGSFIADSAYKFISIGNFFTESMQDSIMIQGNQCYSYYFLDDVCVSTDSLFAYNYSYSTGIENINDNSHIKIYPNPAQSNQNLWLDGISLNEIKSARLINNIGEEIDLPLKAENNKIKIENIEELSGLNHLTVLLKNGEIIKRKIIIN